MSASAMLKIPVYLEAQPGMRTKPELHLKERMGSVTVELFILDRTGLSDIMGKTCVISGTLPGGEKLFIRSSLVADWGRYKVSIYNSNVKKMCKTAGKYECTLSVLDNGNASVNESNFTDYDTHTVLPFTVVVEQTARRGAYA